MQNKQKTHVLCTRVIAFLIILFLSACNWVDSTGRQGNNTPTIDLADGDVISSLEENSITIDATASDSDGTVDSYVWTEATEQGSLQVCVNHLDLDIAGESLESVCEDADNCEILFIEDEVQTGVFNVMTPKITAPIGITHQLSVTDNDGGVVELNIHFCLDSVNDAPVAGEDTYTVAEGTSLEVAGTDANNLLQNDSDDNDIRNQGLTVLGVVDGQGPQHADSFNLGKDGGFTYSISPFTPFTVTQDTFTYLVSDGSNISQGSAVLDLSVIDDPPVAVGSIPPQNATVGVAFGSFDVSIYFSDPERTQLSFSATGLPQGISISSVGVISGTATENNSAGDYSIVVSASDGQSSVSHNPFIMSLAGNEPPQLDSQLADQLATVGVAFSVNAASSFSDPEGVPLTFTAAGLPGSFSISSAGVISGTAVGAELGQYTVTVTASDGVGETLMTFGLEVQPNQPPIQLTGIPRQLVSIGSQFSLDVSQYFSDPENDPITYSASGLPLSNSLTITPAGVISGIPVPADQTGILGSQVTITATDSNGNSVTGSFNLAIL